MVAINHELSWKLPVRYPAIRSERAREVARWFGLRETPRAEDCVDVSGVVPAGGEILLVTGASGAGKSCLLAAVLEHEGYAPRVANDGAKCFSLSDVAVPDAPLVDCFPELSLTDVLSLLARVGLSEAWTFIRTPAELSEGQRWRLRLALVLHETRNREDSLVVCDEFAAVLDRVTACVVAHALARVVRSSGNQLRAILVTSHDDLVDAIEPDIHVRCDFGRAEMVRRRESGN